ncbi:hypothetical protein JCM6882_006813 [Rhodosporidiobolus microsporus]
MYWLCQDRDYGPVVSYTDRSHIHEAPASAVAMGASTICIHTGGISVGPNKTCNLEPLLGNFNNVLWDIHNYVLHAACNNFYHGGKYSFFNFAGVLTTNKNKGTKVHANQAATNTYTSYILAMLTRVKRYTAFPATMNRPSLPGKPETNPAVRGLFPNLSSIPLMPLLSTVCQHMEVCPPVALTTAIVNTICRFDKNHIVVNGINGFYNLKTGAVAEGLKVSTVDMMTDHSYPRSVGLIQKEQALAKSAKKGFFIGEFDWTFSHRGNSLSSYLSAIEGAGSYPGNLISRLFIRSTVHGNLALNQANILAVVKHWYKVTGRSQPSRLPAVACRQPVF